MNSNERKLNQIYFARASTSLFEPREPTTGSTHAIFNNNLLTNGPSWAMLIDAALTNGPRKNGARLRALSRDAVGMQF